MTLNILHGLQVIAGKQSNMGTLYLQNIEIARHRKVTEVAIGKLPIRCHAWTLLWTLRLSNVSLKRDEILAPTQHQRQRRTQGNGSAPWEYFLGVYSGNVSWECVRILKLS
jgi:hypothetical protein